VKAVLSQVWEKGSEGGVELAEEVVRLCGEKKEFRYSYELEGSVEDKLNKIARRVYGQEGVVLSTQAAAMARQIEDAGFGNLPVCVAKTQYSLTDDPKLTGAHKGCMITVRGLRLAAGAGFIVALTGDIMTMPGLPKKPAAENIDVSSDGRISGLF
jgi:formate--tetrahydrofolate ligase